MNIQIRQFKIRAVYSERYVLALALDEVLILRQLAAAILVILQVNPVIFLRFFLLLHMFINIHQYQNEVIRISYQ